IEALLKELPFRFTVQPIKEPVAYRLGDPSPFDVKERDYFRIDLIGYRRTNPFLRGLHRGFQQLRDPASTFARYIDAINLQQAVPWRINRPLWQWTKRLYALANDPVQDEAAAAGLHDWIRGKFYQPVTMDPRKAVERPIEFLVNPLALHALADLSPEAGEPPTFYLPWKADYRGRIYAETPWLTPQGGDAQRAVLELKQGRTLDESGIQALRRHGGNLVKRERLLDDLKITDRLVVTLAERESWVTAHEAQIIASARAPLSESFWREAASKPMQFLAFCLAYRQWREDPETPIHLPAQIDGTCNGLQHIAALIGDQDLARSVNVLPREDTLPRDIYSELAKAAAESLGSLTAESDKQHGLGLMLADRWLAESPDRRDWINRDTAKTADLYQALWKNHQGQDQTFGQVVGLDEFDRPAETG
ncbi:MAG: DNA-directed RNA polymerase, partial [Dongiaceae bacterium]